MSDASNNQGGAPDEPSGPIVGDPDFGPSSKPIPQKQEEARRGLAFFLVIIMLLEVIFAMTASWMPCRFGFRNVPLEELKDIMEVIFAPTVALVGSAAGFYFGRSSAGG